MLSRIHEKIIFSKQKENIRKGFFLEAKANFMVETDWISQESFGKSAKSANGANYSPCPLRIIPRSLRYSLITERNCNLKSR